MNDDRRPLGLPEFSAPATDRPVVTDRRPLPPVDRALFLPPPAADPEAESEAESEAEPSVRRPLAGGGLTFSGGA